MSFLRSSVSVALHNFFDHPDNLIQPLVFKRITESGTPSALYLATLIRASVPFTEGIAAVGKFDRSIFSLLLIGCALGSTVILPVQADNGIITIKRDVQTRNATIPPLIPDPNPTTVNANPSRQILQQTNELSDGDFANVASGAGINRLVTQNTNNLGGNISNQTQLSNLPAGRSGNSGNGIANMVNSNIQQGLGALKIITGDR
jgi:hypothetical protein